MLAEKNYVNKRYQTNCQISKKTILVQSMVWVNEMQASVCYSTDWRSLHENPTMVVISEAAICDAVELYCIIQACS